MKTVTPPAPSIIGILRNIKTAAFNATAKLAGYRAAAPTNSTNIGSRIGTDPNTPFSSIMRNALSFTAEYAAKNDPIAAGYLAQRENYCSSQLIYIPSTGDAKLDAEIKIYLHGADGFGGKFATMGVDCSMRDAFSRTADIETPVRGDAGMIIWMDGDDDIRLIEFSADQLGELYGYTYPRSCSLKYEKGEIVECPGNDCQYFSGRYFKGADCIAYKIYQRQNSWYGNPKIYSASDIFYFVDPCAFRGARGVSIFAPALLHMQKGEDMFQAALSAAQRQARTFGRVFNQNGQPDEPSYTQDASGRITFFEKVPGAPVEEFYYDGDQAEFAAPNTPSAEVIAGVDTAAERAAIALRMNYAFIISATKVGGAPSRLEINKAAKELSRIQNIIHRPRLRRLVDLVLMNAVRKGDIKPPRGMTSTQYKQGSWMLPISPVVDAGYENDENLKNLRAGLESPQELCAEQNRNFETILEQKAQAAIAVAVRADEANKYLASIGIKGTISSFDLMQLSENPVQFQQAENLQEGKPTSSTSYEDKTPKDESIPAEN